MLGQCVAADECGVNLALFNEKCGNNMLKQPSLQVRKKTYLRNVV